MECLGEIDQLGVPLFAAIRASDRQGIEGTNTNVTRIPIVKFVGFNAAFAKCDSELMGFVGCIREFTFDGLTQHLLDVEFVFLFFNFTEVKTGVTLEGGDPQGEGFVATEQTVLQVLVELVNKSIGPLRIEVLLWNEWIWCDERRPKWPLLLFLIHLEMHLIFTLLERIGRIGIRHLRYRFRLHLFDLVQRLLDFAVFMRIKIADENRDLIEVLQVEQFHLLTYRVALTIGRRLPSQTGGRLFQINVMKIDIGGQSQFATNFKGERVCYPGAGGAGE